MNLPETYRKPKYSAGILPVFALAVFHSAFSQTELDRASNDLQREIAETIREVETQHGPNAAELIEPLTVLGLSYLEAGDHLLAAVATQRALDVVRINHGLHSLEQVALMQQLIANEAVFGNAAAVWDLEQELLALAARHPVDPRTVPIFRAVADKRMGMLNRYLGGEMQREIVAGCFYDMSLSDSVGSCHSGERSTVFQRVVAEVQGHYADAISVLLRNELYSSEDLRELELELARSSDLLRVRENDGDRTLELEEIHTISHTEPWLSQTQTMIGLARWDLDYSLADSMLGDRAQTDRDMALRSYRRQDQYELGRLALSRLVAYAHLGSNSQRERILALVQLADWDLLYSRNSLASEQYLQAWELMIGAGFAPQLVNEIFSPEVPVVLPAFNPDLRLTDVGREFDGAGSGDFIDVSFDVTRFGQSRRVDITDSSTNVSRDDARRLVQQIRRSRFRPRIEDGRIVDSSDLAVRYFIEASP